MSAAFHVLDTDVPDRRLIKVAELCETAYQAGKKILIYSDLPALLERVNHWLWAFRPDSFLPNQCINGDLKTPIILAHGTDHEPADILVNLSETVPEFFHQHAEIIEVVNQEPLVLNTSRRHYAFYQSEGLSLSYEKCPATP